MAADVTISGTVINVPNQSPANIISTPLKVVVPSDSRVDIVSGIQQFGSPRPSTGFIYPRGLD
jgi:hypothetical protein